MNKILKIFFSIYTFLLIWINNIFAKSPDLVCNWLPGCTNKGIGEVVTWVSKDTSFFWYIWNLISILIQYVAVVSVFVLIFAWIRYILSIWKDDEAVKARKMIVWSLVWVLISNAAWFLVNLVNNFNFN